MILSLHKCVMHSIQCMSVFYVHMFCDLVINLLNIVYEINYVYIFTIVLVQ